MASTNLRSECRFIRPVSSAKDASVLWLGLQLRVEATEFSIILSEEDFRNSPFRLGEFQQIVYLVAGGPQQHASTINKYAQMVVSPFLKQMKAMAPRVPNLQSSFRLNMYHGGRWCRCPISVVNECFRAGKVDYIGANNTDSRLDALRQGSCPSLTDINDMRLSKVSWTDIEIVPHGSGNVWCQRPEVVRIMQEGHSNTTYLFRSFDDVTPSQAKELIQMSDAIAKADFAENVRVMRAAGVAVDATNRAVGLLTRRIENSTPLQVMAERGAITAPLARLWKAELLHTVQALHGKNITRMDPHPSSLYVDGDLDLYITKLVPRPQGDWALGRPRAGSCEYDCEELQKTFLYLDRVALDDSQVDYLEGVCAEDII